MIEYQNFINYFEQYPPLIIIIWIGIAVFVLIILILIISIKLLRNHLRKKENIIKEYEKEYESNLIAYLYSGNEEEDISPEQRSIITQLKYCASDKFKRKVIVSVLLKLKSEISGEMDDSIQKLYFEADLLKYALDKLKSKRWYIIAYGIRELTLFNVKEVHDEVIKKLHHPKRIVQKEVQLYLVNLFHFKGLDFLNDLKTPLSEWDQIQLLEELQKFENQEIPDITPWLRSENESVVFFALKLAKIYNQFGVKNALIDLLSHKSKEVRIRLISVLSHLQVLESKEVLKNNFNEYSQDEQVAFFEMLENIFESNDESFLLEHSHHNNFEIKYSILKILKILNFDELRILRLASGDSEYAKIVKFVENN